jgi:hypothetical protein
VEIDLKLHPHQFDVFNDPRRFKIVAAGRRWGKSRLAVAVAIAGALQNEMNGYDLQDMGVFIVAPTHDQAKRIYLPIINRIANPLITKRNSMTGRFEFENGRWIEVRGADNPDALRGVGLSDVILDEYATMKANVWDEILGPALTDVGGRAFFIGTPAGKNHFHSLIQEALNNEEEWGVWTFKSTDNPFLDKREIEKARKRMTLEQFRQEYEASFHGSGSGFLKRDWLKIAEEPTSGYYVMTVDLAGYTDDSDIKSRYVRRDEHAMVVTKIHQNGWHIKDIRHGTWGTRECAVQMLKMAHDYGLKRIGIEKGALYNAIMPYLTDRMAAIKFFPEIVPLWHGGKKKNERIMWGLAPHAEHGRLTLEPHAPWYNQFEEQWMDFPNKLAKDDLIDAAAYAAQFSDEGFEDLAELDAMHRFEPLDREAGY